MNKFMKICLGVIIAMSVISYTAFAFGEYAGLYEFTGKLNENIYGCIYQFDNCYAWGLINDEDNTITANLEASPEIAPYITMPSNITIEPHQTNFVNVSVLVPCRNYDIICDGKIDTRDISIVAKCFNQPITCNPKADINGDGKIDMRDISLVSRHFGETYGTINGTLYATIYGTGYPIRIDIRLAKNIQIIAT